VAHQLELASERVWLSPRCEQLQCRTNNANVLQRHDSADADTCADAFTDAGADACANAWANVCTSTAVALFVVPSDERKRFGRGNF
jgi:hypothetical protein